MDGGRTVGGLLGAGDLGAAVLRCSGGGHEDLAGYPAGGRVEPVCLKGGKRPGMRGAADAGARFSQTKEPEWRDRRGTATK